MAVSPGPGEHEWPSPRHGLMSIWQPDRHKDKLDESVCVDISMPGPGQARPLDASPLSRARPSPAFVNISKCQAKSPSMQTSAEH